MNKEAISIPPTIIGNPVGHKTPPSRLYAATRPMINVAIPQRSDNADVGEKRHHMEAQTQEEEEPGAKQPL